MSDAPDDGGITVVDTFEEPPKDEKVNIMTSTHI